MSHRRLGRVFAPVHKKKDGVRAPKSPPAKEGALKGKLKDIQAKRGWWPVRQPKTRARRTILETTLRLLGQGVASPSMRQIAREAGVSPGAAYHHFENHWEILRAVAAEGFDALGQRIDPHTTLPDARASLRAVITHYVLFCFEHSAHYRTMFNPNMGRDEDLEARARARFTVLVEVVGRARPDLGPARSMAQARCAWAMAHGAVLLGLDDLLVRIEGPSSPQHIAQETAQAVVAMVMSTDQG